MLHLIQITPHCINKPLHFTLQQQYNFSSISALHATPSLDVLAPKGLMKVD